MKHPPCRIRPLSFLLASLPLLALLSASPVRAGIHRFTPYGPGGGSVQALAVDPATPGTLYAAMADTREVYKSTDSAATWTWASAGLPAALRTSALSLALDPGHPQTLYAGIGPQLFRSTDGAAHWAAVATGLAPTPVFQLSNLAFAPGSPGVLFFTYGPHLLRSVDGGTAWAPVFDAPQEILALLVDPAAPRTLYLGTLAGGGTWRSTNGGDSFTRVKSLLGDVTAFAASTVPGLLYAASSGRIYASTNGGVLWGPRGVLAGVSALAVDPFFPDTLFAGSAGISVSRDGGKTWQAARGFPSSFPLVRVLAADPTRPGELYAGSASQGVYRSTRAGRMWTAQSQRGLTAASAWGPFIHAAVPSTVYVLLSDQFLWRSTDGGQSWERRGTFPYIFDTLALDPLDPDTLYVTYTRGFSSRAYSYRSTDGGATWGGESFIGETVILDLVAGKDTLLAMGKDGIYRSTDGGGSWRLGLDACCLYSSWLMRDPARLTTFYLVNPTDNMVYRSEDLGVTWQPFVDADAIAVAPSRPATLYAVTLGTAANRLRRSNNAGRSWTEVGPLPVDMREVVVDPRVPTTLYAVRASQGVWRSTDGGVTWTWVSASLNRVGRSGIDYVSVAAYPGVPPTFYVTPGLGGMFEAQFDD